MLASREKLEDLKWLAEVYNLMEKAVENYGTTGDPKWRVALDELTAEATRVKASIDAGEWKDRQAKADAHCKGRGCIGTQHLCWRYG